MRPATTTQHPHARAVPTRQQPACSIRMPSTRSSTARLVQPLLIVPHEQRAAGVHRQRGAAARAQVAELLGQLLHLGRRVACAARVGACRTVGAFRTVGACRTVGAWMPDSRCMPHPAQKTWPPTELLFTPSSVPGPNTPTPTPCPTHPPTRCLLRLGGEVRVVGPGRARVKGGHGQGRQRLLVGPHQVCWRGR
jgi:hypothetical protein